jgi:hypothetical protein
MAYAAARSWYAWRDKLIKKESFVGAGRSIAR